MSSSPPLLPFSFDALLPTPERYASAKFRRVAQVFRFKHLDWYDAVELVAFVESIGLKYARYMLHWKGQATIKAYRKLRKHVGAEADEAIRANIEAMGVDAGLAILKSMQDGGWTRGKLPWMCRMALTELRKRGNSHAAIARAVGLTHEQVRTATGSRTRRKQRERATAFGALAV